MSLAYVQSISSSKINKSDVILYQIESMAFPDMIIYQDMDNTILADILTTIDEIPNEQSTGMITSYDTHNNKHGIIWWT